MDLLAPRFAQDCIFCLYSNSPPAKQHFQPSITATTRVMPDESQLLDNKLLLTTRLAWAWALNQSQSQISSDCITNLPVDSTVSHPSYYNCSIHWSSKSKPECPTCDFQVWHRVMGTMEGWNKCNIFQNILQGNILDWDQRKHSNFCFIYLFIVWDVEEL